MDDFDLFTYSFPCTDISNAGCQKGLSENSGTRSSLLWECKKAIEEKHPKYVLMENVKALVSNKFFGDFVKWGRYLSSLGYSNYWQVLNAKDFGVPQNRERVFMISILGNEKYCFPKPFPLKKRLKDVLEENVEERYFLSDDMLKSFERITIDKSNGHTFRPHDENSEGSAFTVTTREGCTADNNYILQRSQGFNAGGIHKICPTISTSSWEQNNVVVDICQCGQIYSTKHNPINGRVYDIIGLSPTLRTPTGGLSEPKIVSINSNPRIRRITPREALSLMDVSEENIDKMVASDISNSQLYKLAGNSIVVSCLYHIFRELFVTKSQPAQMQLF